MRILHIISSINPSKGGPSQGLQNYISEFHKLGFNNEVVCLDHSEKYSNIDKPYIYILGPCESLWCYSAKLLPWLLHNLNTYNVVIVHGLWLYHGYAIHKAIKLLKKKNGFNQKLSIPKVYIMPHGMLDPYFQRAPERKFKALRNWVYWKLIQSKIVNNADGILFTCNSELMLARETFRQYYPKKEINIGYGIQEPPAFRESMRKAFLEQCSELNDQPYFLFLSRIHKKKGVDLLIKSYLRIIEENNIKIKTSTFPILVIAGPGIDTTYGRRVMKLSRTKIGLGKFIYFPGMLTGDAKWGAFWGAEAFILPSHQENFGIAVVEAMACSKPVLISKQINIWREIKEDGGGLVEEDTLGGTYSLLSAWHKLSLDEKIKIGNQARISFEKNFDIAPAAIRFLKAIQNEK